MKSEAECRTGKSLTRQQLEKRLKGIIPPDAAAEREAWKRWDSVAKPLRSLGVLEEAVASAAGIFGTWQVDFGKKAVVILCADNGIVEEGISQTGKEVTAVVTSNFTRGDSCVCLMAESAGAQVFPVDIGVEKELCSLGKKYPLIHKNVRRGTRNFLKEPALTEEETVQALEIGIDLVDFKLEFGRLSDGTVILADEISPDTCRLWDTATGEKLDKDRFRRDLGGVEEAYAEIMKRLVEHGAN